MVRIVTTVILMNNHVPACKYHAIRAFREVNLKLHASITSAPKATCCTSNESVGEEVVSASTHSGPGAEKKYGNRNPVV